MGDVAGEMGAKACRTRSVLSDGMEDECERDAGRVMARLSEALEALLLADVQRRSLLHQRWWPEW